MPRQAGSRAARRRGPRAGRRGRGEDAFVAARPDCEQAADGLNARHWNLALRGVAEPAAEQAAGPSVPEVDLVVGGPGDEPRLDLVEGDVGDFVGVPRQRSPRRQATDLADADRVVAVGEPDPSG